MKVGTQRELAFYKLYVEFKLDPERYVQTWEFGGEIQIKPMNKWALMTYKCPARLSEIYLQNPGLLDRKKFTGKSGSTYFGYRIAPSPSATKIKDEKLLAFYGKIKKPSV